MKKIKFLFISLLFLFLITLFYLMLHDKCRTLNIFKSTSDFGTGYIQACFSSYNIKENVRKRLVNFPILQRPIIKLYQKYYLSQLDLKDPERSNLVSEGEVVIGSFGAMHSKTIDFITISLIV